MKIDRDTKEFIIAVLVWASIFVIFLPMFLLWYDFRNFTICFFGSLGENSYCNFDSLDNLLDNK